VRKMVWKDDVEEDVLAIRETEIEELDNDEITANEAGFLEGYHASEED